MGKTHGSRTYPVEYTYDYAGRMKTMKTWQNYSIGAGAAVTTWSYDATRGWLTSKAYPESGTVSYAYTAAGRLQQRTWARGLVTTNGYNSLGDLALVDYLDGTTPDISYGYNRLGRQVTAAAGGSTVTRHFDLAGVLLGESFSGGPLGGLSVTNEFDEFLRRTNLMLKSGSAVLTTNAYGYNASSGWLETVSDGAGNSASYGYVANSMLVSNIVFMHEGDTRMTTTKSHDVANRLTEISSVPSGSGATPLTFDYALNAASQRTAITNADGSRWVYQYDALGQVTSGKKYWADSTPAAGQQFEYAFDDIGNRKTAAQPSGLDARRSTYLANPLNQYISRTVPGVVDILGTANSNATVTVNLQPTARKGENFHRPLALNNRAGAVWQAVTNLAVLNNGTNADILSSNVGSIFLPQTPEVYAYDADGNLTRDGHWTLTWNGENRLIALETVPAAVATGVPKEKLEFTYDHQGRRVRKQVYAWDTDHWSLTSDLRFVYDGWNLVAILDSQSSLLQSFTWGLDLSGSLQGAGGVGGLLAVFDPSTLNSQPSTHFACFDGNGNVMALVDAADGTESARYEYGPFGEVIRATGPMAKANPFRFSTKYQDEETGWNYYGHRFLNSPVGRWLSRDPIAEEAFYMGYTSNADFNLLPLLYESRFETMANLQIFVINNPLSAIDIDGARMTPGGNVPITPQNRRKPPSQMKLVKVKKCSILVVYGHNWVNDFTKRGLQLIWNIVPAKDSDKNLSYAAVVTCAATQVPNEIRLPGYTPIAATALLSVQQMYAEFKSVKAAAKAAAAQLCAYEECCNNQKSIKVTGDAWGYGLKEWAGYPQFNDFTVPCKKTK